MNFRGTWSSLLLTSLLLATSHGSQASLIGDTVNAENIDAVALAEFVQASAVVVDGGAPEFVLRFETNDLFSFDFGANTLKITSLRNNIFLLDEAFFSDLDWMIPAQIVGVSVDIGAGINAGFTASDVTHTADTVTIDFEGSQWAQNAMATITLHTAHVAEPSALGLLGLGLAGFCFRRRRIRA